MRRMVLPTFFIVLTVASEISAAEVRGRVEMPELCAPEVSPAVVFLEPKDTKLAPSLGSASRDVALVNQHGLQFVPRVQAMSVGQTLRFTNEDSETHNVHILSPGFEFNQSMTPGQPREFVPERSGVIRLACDIHSHMRGYVVVSGSPWFQVCSRKGGFRLDGVPEGQYTLTVWHEMGDRLEREVTIGAEDVDLGTLKVTGPTPSTRVAATAPARPWADVIDRISVLLASSLDAATHPGGFKKARKLAQDAYWVEFETSDMETAVRLHLGFARAGELEGRFRSLIPALRGLAEGQNDPTGFTDLSRQLLLDLNQASAELNRKGVVDRTQLYATATVPTSPIPVSGDPKGQLQTLLGALQHVRELADKSEPEDAAAAMTAAYWEQFEPLERHIQAYDPQSIRPLETRFTNLRGEVGAGLKGERLATALTALSTEVEASLAKIEARPSGAFAPAFAASLVTILREGVEVILILTMLLTLVAKTGQPGARRAIWSGVAIAVVASVVTAVGLNSMVASTQGRVRELVEGGVMLVAAGVLFYVSYWLISQSESKRWMNFLKQRTAQSAALGGLGTLAFTAFLAVYREGAETALMYQAMIGSQAHSQAALTGLVAGLGVGLLLLGLIAVVIRATSVRLPMRTFFALTGCLLFAMSVIFAGNGVFALQESGILRATPVAWLGTGIPALGLHPNSQSLSVQAMLVAGALLALVLSLTGGRSMPSLRSPDSNVSTPPATVQA